MASSANRAALTNCRPAPASLPNIAAPSRCFPRPGSPSGRGRRKGDRVLPGLARTINFAPGRRRRMLCCGIAAGSRPSGRRGAGSGVAASGPVLADRTAAARRDGAGGMAAGISQRGKSLFPCIRITVMGSARRVLSPAMSAAALLGLCGGAVLLGCLGIARISEPRQVAREERAAMRAERVNADLQDAIARLQDKLARAEGERSEAENRLSALAGQAAALRRPPPHPKRKLCPPAPPANPLPAPPARTPRPEPEPLRAAAAT